MNRRRRCPRTRPLGTPQQRWGDSHRGQGERPPRQGKADEHVQLPGKKAGVGEAVHRCHAPRLRTVQALERPLCAAAGVRRVGAWKLQFGRK